MPYLGKMMPVSVVNKLVRTFVPALPEVKNPYAYADFLLSSPHKPKLLIREYYPQSKPKHTEPLPTIFYVPGTAFMHSPQEASHRICSQLAIKTGCQVIRLDHSLAPKHTYDEAAEQIFGSYKHIMKYPDYFHVDPDKVAIAGYSSGGFLAALTALRAVEENLTVPKQILISPIIELSSAKSKKYGNFENQDHIVTKEYVNAFLSKCKPPNQQHVKDCLSPLKYSKKITEQLPRVDIIVSEYDRFRGHAHAYDKRLAAYHVPHTLQIIKGQNHAYLWREQEAIGKLAGIIAKSLELPNHKQQNEKLKRTLNSSHRRGASRKLFDNPFSILISIIKKHSLAKHCFSMWIC